MLSFLRPSLWYPMIKLFKRQKPEPEFNNMLDWYYREYLNMPTSMSVSAIKKLNRKHDRNLNDIHNLFERLHAPKKVKIGRNDPCHCGSGKKYKKCCGR